MTCKKRIYFETRIDIQPDLTFVETFHDGSQLIRKRGHMVIIESTNAYISKLKLKANLQVFSSN